MDPAAIGNVSIYHGVDIVLATKHGKDAAVAPAFADLLGARIIPVDVDTDLLGTFTGEVPRLHNMLDCARLKCEWGLDHAGARFGLASEGSFGPHPMLPFLPADHEVLYFIDRDRELYLHVAELSTATNYRSQEVGSMEEALAFAAAAGFPSHALILRPHNVLAGEMIFKGLQSMGALEDAFDQCRRASEDRLVWLQTDMRAHLNPSRMAVIAALARILATRLATLCPACGSPGWGLTAVQPGLECAWCGGATTQAKFDIFGCACCNYQEHRPPAHGLTAADPGECAYCNP